MKKIDSKIVPMNVASLNLEFVMNSSDDVTCIVRTPQGAVLDLVDVSEHMDDLSDSLGEILDLAIEQIDNVANHE